MAKSATLPATQNIKCPNRQITNGDGTTALQLQIAGVNYAMGAEQGILKSLMLTSTDTAAQNVQIIINDGTNDRIVGTVAVPLGSGTNGVAAAVDALAITSLPGLVVDKNGKTVLPLGSSYAIKIKPLVAITAAKTIDCFAVIEEY